MLGCNLDELVHNLQPRFGISCPARPFDRYQLPSLHHFGLKYHTKDPFPMMGARQ
jgi:hypothetical protein